MAVFEGVRLRFDHVSLAVNSIERVAAFFARYFPISKRNEKTPCEQASGDFYWKDFYLGACVIELIEDRQGEEGFVSRFIRRRGEGLHHLSFEVERLAPIVGALRADGVRVVDEYDFGDGTATAFISPRAAFGTLIQLWQVANYDLPHDPPASDGRARFDHVAIAVKEIDRALDFFQRYFPSRLVREKHLSNSTGNFVLAQVEVGGGTIELLQSPGTSVADDFVARFLARRGEGLHHISLSLKEFDGVLARLKQAGVRVVDERHNHHGRRQFFVSPRSAFGVLIQVWDGV